MTRSELAIEVIRAWSVVALAACALFLLLIWGSDTLGLEPVSNVLQTALDVSVLALVGAAAAQVLVAFPLWLIPRLRRSHG